MSDSLPPHGVEHSRLPCPSLAPGVCSNSCPLNWLCYPMISSLLCPLLLLPLIFASIRVFSNELALCIRWPKKWSVIFSITPSNEYSELIFFRIDWFDLLAVQGTNSPLKHHSSKHQFFWRWAFFMVQLSQLYMTTGKNTALTLRTFVTMRSLLFSKECFLGLSQLFFQEASIF